MIYIGVTKSRSDNMNILPELYYGNINPHALKINNSNFEKLLELMAESKDALIGQLTDKQKILFEKIRDCDCKISNVTEMEIFIQSLKLGTEMILEIMSDD